jgi:hypothetical protein
VRLPTALLYPSPLLLPSSCLLLCTLWLLLLPGLLRLLLLLLRGGLPRLLNALLRLWLLGALLWLGLPNSLLLLWLVLPLHLLRLTLLRLLGALLLWLGLPNSLLLLWLLLPLRLLRLTFLRLPALLGLRGMFLWLTLLSRLLPGLRGTRLRRRRSLFLSVSGPIIGVALLLALPVVLCVRRRTEKQQNRDRARNSRELHDDHSYRTLSRCM